MGHRLKIPIKIRISRRLTREIFFTLLCFVGGIGLLEAALTGLDQLYSFTLESSQKRIDDTHINLDLYLESLKLHWREWESFYQSKFLKKGVLLRNRERYQQDQPQPAGIHLEESFYESENVPACYYRDHFPPKNDQTYRIFVIGASTAYGYGVPEQDSFAQRLWHKLQQRWPAIRFEVYDAGVPTVDSSYCYQVARKIASELAPDLLIVLTGNNEWITFRYPLFLEELANQDTFFIRRLLRRSHIYQGLTYLVRRLIASDLGDSWLRWLDRYQPHCCPDFLDRSGFCSRHPYQANAEFQPAHWLKIKELGLKRYRRNMTRLYASSYGQPLSIIFLTTPMRYHLPVCWFMPQPRHITRLDRAEENRWQQHFDRGNTFLAAGRYKDAIDQYLAARTIDPVSALLEQQLGWAYEHIGERGQAVEHYRQANDAMIGHLGGLTSFNRILGEVTANKPQSYFLDLNAKFDEIYQSRGDPFGDTFFLDDCHPNAAGHELIASAIFELIETRADSLLGSRFSPAPSPVQTNEDWTAQGVRAIYQRDFDQAVAALQKALAGHQKDAVIWNLLGFSLVQKKEPALAKPALDRAIELAPQFWEAYLNRAYAELDLGQKGAAKRDLEQVLRLKPDHEAAGRMWHDLQNPTASKGERNSW